MVTKNRNSVFYRNNEIEAGYSYMIVWNRRGLYPPNDPDSSVEERMNTLNFSLGAYYKL